MACGAHPLGVKLVPGRYGKWVGAALCVEQLSRIIFGQGTSIIGKIFMIRASANVRLAGDWLNLQTLYY